MNKINKSPKMEAKHFHYQNDGTGRDLYVSINNGGLLSPDLVKKLEVFPQISHTPMSFPKNTYSSLLSPRGAKPISMHMKMNHYYGDGKGRDHFVIVNDGGQAEPHHWKNHPDKFFPSSLRNYQQQWQERPDVEKYQSKQLKTNTEVKAKRQNILSRQLSNPQIVLYPDYKFTTNYKSYQEPQFQTKSRMNQL